MAVAAQYGEVSAKEIAVCYKKDKTIYYVVSGQGKLVAHGFEVLMEQLGIPTCLIKADHFVLQEKKAIDIHRSGLVILILAENSCHIQMEHVERLLFNAELPIIFDAMDLLVENISTSVQDILWPVLAYAALRPTSRTLAEAFL